MKKYRMFGQAIRKTIAKKPSIVGLIDGYQDEELFGWVLDRRQEGVPLNVVVGDKAKKIGHTSANVHRPDLVPAGFAAANHGFRVPLDCGNVQSTEDLEAWAEAPAPSTDRVKLAVHSSVIERLQRVVSDDIPLQRKLAATSQVILIDIQDVIEFLKNNKIVTGIQRVSLGLIQAVVNGQRADSDNVAFCMIASKPDTVRIFDRAKLNQLVAMAGEAGVDTMRSFMEDLIKNSVLYSPKAGDVFFILGAYWIVEDFSAWLNALKDEGVVIGTYIYDIIPITAPRWVTEDTRLDVTGRAVDIMYLSDFFLTDSEYVAKEIRHLLNWETGLDKQVSACVLPHQMPARRADQAQVRKSISNLPPFVLCVGTLEGRKNHMLLFRIWAALVRKHGAKNIPLLVLVGKWGWDIDSFRTAFEQSDGLNGQIRIFNNLGDAEVEYLYRTCLFTTFASFVEGWGLPVGESLSFGKMCIASNSSSIPEVGTTYCEYFDPHDFFTSSRVIERAIINKDETEKKNQNVAEISGRVRGTTLR